MMKTGLPHPVTQGHYDAIILQMRKDGNNVLQIGSELGCSVGPIKRRLAILKGTKAAPGNTGRPLHAVTLGKHDTELLLMVGKGVDPLVMSIMLKCNETTVLNRLAALRGKGV